MLGSEISAEVLGPLRLARGDTTAAVVVVAEDDHVSWASEGALSLLGLHAPGDPLAFAELFAPGDRPAAAAVLALARCGDEPVVRRLAPADGGPTLLLNARRTHGSGGVVCSLLAAETSSPGDAAFRLLAENASDLVCRHDPGGVYAWVSPSSRRLLGWDPSDLLGRSPYEFVHPADVDAVARSHSAVLVAPGDPDGIVYRFRHRDGRWVWLQTTSWSLRRENGRVVEIHTLSRDVTDAVTARLALEREHGMLSAALGMMAQGVAITDVAGRVEIVNDVLCATLGLARDALVGMAPPYGFWHPSRAAETERLIREAIGAGGGEFESLVATPEGGRLPVTVAVSARRDDHGELDGVILGITELREVRARTETERSLRRVAAAVAEGRPAGEVFRVVAEQVAWLFGADVGLVLRFEGTGEAEVVGAWGALADPVGSRLPAVGEGAVARARATGAPARVGSYAGLPAGEPIREHVLRGARPRSSVAAPVMVNGVLWGAVLASEGAEHAFGPADEMRLMRIAALVELAIGSADARARLVEQANTDFLTGLANHRVFREELGRAVAAAGRHRRGASLAMLDIDLFKRVNDAHGHRVGDAVLREIADVLRAQARDGDMVARVGGEEFGWLMPGMNADDALAAVERAREAVASLRLDPAGTVTISAGIADLSRCDDPDELIRLADGALYWAKRHGRDSAVVYSPERVEVFSDAESAERLRRRQALSSIQVLARAVDAKDRTTHLHSRRVADVAAAIAGVLGWDLDRVIALHEAGMVHDVGKIAVPDAILFKPHELTPDEMVQVRAHALIGARIVDGVLEAEQVAWVRGHHERWDGGGYPDGLAGLRIPEGARILALADAFDVMTSTRPYSRPLSVEEALEECLRNAGGQFWPEAVMALGRLVEGEALPRPGGTSWGTAVILPAGGPAGVPEGAGAPPAAAAAT